MRIPIHFHLSPKSSDGPFQRKLLSFFLPARLVATVDNVASKIDAGISRHRLHRCSTGDPNSRGSALQNALERATS